MACDVEQFDSGVSVKMTLPDRVWVINDPKVFRNSVGLDKTVSGVFRHLFLGAAPWPLLLWGSAGSGKTCAALTLLDYAGGLYHTVRSLAEEVSKAMLGTLQYDSGYSKTQVDIGQDVGRSQLVVLDELGERKDPSDHERYCVKRMLDLRQGRPLVCISNRPLNELSDIYGDPIASRMGCGTIVATSGDRRLSKGTIGMTAAKHHEASQRTENAPVAE